MQSNYPQISATGKISRVKTYGLWAGEKSINRHNVNTNQQNFGNLHKIGLT
jgi:hypothetical protein